MKTTITLLFTSLALLAQAGQPSKILVNPVISGDVTGTNVGGINLGDRNEIVGDVVQPTLVGGALNAIYGPGSDYSAIYGGSLNTIGPGTQSAFIGGGDYNYVQGGIGSAIVGGLQNTTLGDSYNFIGGGSYNTISLNSGWSVIAGGDGNIIDPVPGGDYNINLGGMDNRTVAPGRFFMNILGGHDNQVAASEAWAIGSGVTNTTPRSVEIGLSDRAKVRVTPNAVYLLGLPLVMLDTNGVTYTRIYTQGGVIYSEPVK